MDANDVVGIPVTFWLYHRKLMCTTTQTLYRYILLLYHLTDAQPRPYSHRSSTHTPFVLYVLPVLHKDCCNNWFSSQEVWRCSSIDILHEPKPQGRVLMTSTCRSFGFNSIAQDSANPLENIYSNSVFRIIGPQLTLAPQMDMFSLPRTALGRWACRGEEAELIILHLIIDSPERNLIRFN